MIEPITAAQAGNTLVDTPSIHAENMSIGGNINQYLDPHHLRLTRVSFSAADAAYPPPDFTDQLLELTLEKRTVFIAGSESFEKTDLVRHIACRLISGDECQGLEVVELLRGNDQETRSSIFDILSKEECEDKIVLLYDLHPEKIDYNFEKLLKYASDKNCFFIISVNYGLETWLRSGRLVSDHWFDIPAGRHYSEEQLQSFFLEKIGREHPEFIEDGIEDKHDLLSDSITVEQALSRFTTIDQVNLLLNYYNGLSAFPSDKKLGDLIEMLCQSYEQRIRSWFYQLSHRNKIIALSAALFDGLLTEQYFEALNNITKSSFWETSDPGLKAIDYFDLTFLDAFFQNQRNGGEQYRSSKTPIIKHTLLDLGKLEYRRHFKVALHEFHKLTTHTYTQKSISWELYGTSPKRVLIRKAFTEAVRDIGMLEFNIVENHLLELAASRNSYLQNIGAKAMAQWRLSGNEQLFFDTLESWRLDHTIAARIKELFERSTADSETDNVNAVDLIKVTAVLALGHASYYDQPNRLHEEIIQKMVHFAKDGSPKVIESVQKALPKFIHHHSLQLQHILFEELMPIYELRNPITEGLTLALEDYPGQVFSALENWFNACRNDASRENRRHKPTQRDNILIIILNILENADLQDNRHLQLEKLYRTFLIPLIQEEKRGEVVKAVLSLLAKVQSCDFSLAERFAQETIGVLDKHKRLFLVEQWGLIYKYQRILASPETFEENDSTYPLWTAEEKRPLVPVEQILFRWMEANSTLRRFATLVFLEMERSCDQFERRTILEQIIRRRQLENMLRMQAQQERKPVVFAAPSEISLALMLRIRIFFYFLFSSNANKYLLKDTILLFLNVNRYSSDNLTHVIHKWKTNAQHSITGKLAKWLLRFM